MSFPHSNKASSPPLPCICVVKISHLCMLSAQVMSCREDYGRMSWASRARQVGPGQWRGGWPRDRVLVAPKHSCSQPLGSGLVLLVLCTLCPHSPQLLPSPMCRCPRLLTLVSLATQAQESRRGGGKGDTGKLQDGLGRWGAWRHEGDHLPLMLATPDDVGSHP